MKDLNLLIDRYNEPGIMIANKNLLYWFNGKRFELWYNFEYSDCGDDILYHKNKLYLYSYCDNSVSEFIHKKFIKIEINNNFLLKHFQKTDSKLFILQGNKIIEINDEYQMFDGLQWNTISKRVNTVNGFGMHNDILYLFDEECLKYNCATKVESNFSIPKLIGHCKYINNKFYFFDNGRCKGIFDPQDDKFYASNLLIPSTIFLRIK